MGLHVLDPRTARHVAIAIGGYLRALDAAGRTIDCAAQLDAIASDFVDLSGQPLAIGSAAPDTETVRYMTVAEAAEFANVSTKTIRRLIAEGSLSHYRIGRRVLLAPEDVVAFIEAHRHEAAA